jgi:hypothetical protein
MVNIVYSASNPVIAKVCGCEINCKQKITYALSLDPHFLSTDKKDILRSQIEACKMLLKYSQNESEMAAAEIEITLLEKALSCFPEVEQIS